MNWKFPLACVALLAINQGTAAQSGSTSLSRCLQIAHRNNLSINQARKSLDAREYRVKAENATYFPKVDLLAGYNYLGKPLEINLGQVRDGVVNGSSAQSAAAANEVYKQITGNNLPADVQQNIQNISKNVIGAIYPDYNPALAKQQYFTSSLVVRQPIYLGGKLAVARDVAKAEYSSGQANIDFVSQELDYAVTVQYIRILYYNSLLKSQRGILEIMERYERMAASLVKNDIIPPFQKNWATVAVAHAKTRVNNQDMERNNAMIELKRLLQLPQDSLLDIRDTLHYLQYSPAPPPVTDFWRNSATYKLVETKTALASSAVKASKSFQMPNIFAIANVQLYQNDLPITIPPWLVGVELQWNLFSGFANSRRVKAAKELLDASELANEETRQKLEAGAAIARNQVLMLQKDIETLAIASEQAKLTTKLVGERVDNQMSSIKDVNDALLVEEEIGKAYNAAVLGYWIALATYYNILGTPQQIVAFIP
ncbi:hypothetical protein COR50_18695 [Chitinophaga caeni]|uniref:Transporter n=1 Tax=Chitinophaga caeni TaxID=2029983 RepID=A0A291QYU9_9BACT|nr:TolC family protein [Chitinophaga caeni]ATL49034.1 hypothetical protein COR50_18695 [Chitinophaga caeni]